MAESDRRPLIIGIGARYRGDDEIGLLAIDALREKLVESEVDLVTHSDDPARIMSEWAGRDSVVVIDAVRAEAAPGTVHRIDVASSGLTPASRASSHGNALADAIELSRTLSTLPQSLVVIGVEPQAVELGDEPSAACLASLEELTQLALKEISCTSHP